MTDKQIMDELFAAIAALFFVYNISTEKGIRENIFNLLRDTEKQLTCKTQECEDLKHELDLYKTWYRAKHGDVKNTLGRYRKALDKIEEYCNEQISLTGDLPFRTTESDILDIINKVKGDNR